MWCFFCETTQIKSHFSCFFDTLNCPSLWRLLHKKDPIPLGTQWSSLHSSTFTHPGGTANWMSSISVSNGALESPGKKKYKVKTILNDEGKAGEHGDCTKLCPVEGLNFQLQQHPKSHSCSHKSHTSVQRKWSLEKTSVHTKLRKSHHITEAGVPHSQMYLLELPSLDSVIWILFNSKKHQILIFFS